MSRRFHSQAFRVGDLLYMSDVKRVPDAVRRYTAGAATVVIDCLAADEDTVGLQVCSRARAVVSVSVCECAVKR